MRSMGATAWYRLVLPTSPPFVGGNMVVDTAGSNFKRRSPSTARRSASPPGGLTNIGCNANGTNSSVTFSAVSPNTYYVQVGGAGGATGNLVLHLPATRIRTATALSMPRTTALRTERRPTGQRPRRHGRRLRSRCDSGRLRQLCEGRAVRARSANPWDFYSVPVPALFAAPDPATDIRKSFVTGSDAQAVFAYLRRNTHLGTALYDQDLDGNGIKDGLQYDRTVTGPARAARPTEHHTSGCAARLRAVQARLSLLTSRRGAQTPGR